MTTVFISYRRQDGDAFADAVYDEFERRLGASNVFLDVKGIDYGHHFPTELRRRVQQASVLLVVVGSAWIDARNKDGQRRLDLADDWVRTELREALALRKRVIPVLVRGARMPTREELPADIQDFADCHAFPLNNQWLDLPRLGGIVEGRLSVAEPIVLMAIAASYAFSERAAQRLKARPFSSGDPELSGLASLAVQYYQGVGTSIYYAVLVLGVLVALRTRIGWRLEEMLRISLCTGAGVAIGYALSVPLVAVTGAGNALVTSARLALWFLGLAAGTLYGIRRFAPLRPMAGRTMLILCLAVAAAAFAGSCLQYLSGEWLRNAASTQSASFRSAFWAPVVLTGALLWWRLEPPKRRVGAKEIGSVLLPLVAAMLVADLVAITTSYLPQASNEKDFQQAVLDKQSQDNAIFFAVMGGVAAWRINRLLRRRNASP